MSSSNPNFLGYPICENAAEDEVFFAGLISIEYNSAPGSNNRLSVYANNQPLAKRCYTSPLPDDILRPVTNSFSEDKEAREWLERSENLLNTELESSIRYSPNLNKMVRLDHRVIR